MPRAKLDPRSLTGRLRARAMSFPEVTEGERWLAESYDAVAPKKPAAQRRAG